MELNKDGGVLIEIDYNLIRDLRRQGRHDEAQALINSFQQNKKENTVQMKKEFRRINEKKYAIKREKNNLCTYCNNERVEGKRYCQKHLDYYKRRSKEQYLKKKSEINDIKEPEIISL